MDTTTSDDHQAGIQHAEEVSAKRASAIGKPLTEAEQSIAAHAFEAGARYAREQSDEAAGLLERIISIADLMLATGGSSLPIDMTPPPMWRCDAREFLHKRIRGEA